MDVYLDGLVTFYTLSLFRDGKRNAICESRSRILSTTIKRVVRIKETYVGAESR